MRTRKSIEKEFEPKEGNTQDYYARWANLVTVEILLDIRDLLEKKITN